MQFVDVVGKQMRPLQALPAPNRIIHVKRHVPPAALPRARSGRRASESALPPGKFARPPSLHRCAGDAGNSAWNHSLQSLLRPCQEPSAGIAVELTRVGAGQAKAP
jgi:hypothetical protein